MAYLGRDEWDYSPHHRRPSPHRAHRSSFYLNPDQGYDDGQGLSRTRSQGAGPRPIINVINDMHQDAHTRTDNVPGAFPSAPPAPPPPPAIAGYMPTYAPAYAPAPVYNPGYAAADYDRGRRIDQLAEDVHAIRLDRSHSRYRSRSRGRSDAHSPPDFYRYEMEKLEREKQWRHEQERIKAEAEVQHLKDDARRKQHEIDDVAERKRIVAEYEKKQREDDDYEKEREKHYREKMVREEREKKEKEEAAYQKFLLKQKEEKEKKEKEEKEEKERIDQAMRKRLAEKGFAGNQIEAIINDKKKESTTTTTSTSVTVYGSGSTPVYAKIHRSYLEIDTLRYYNIPYKWDDADSNYIIILQEMDKHETNILFEHTKALREGRLLLEAPKKEKEYAFYRKRDRSKSRSRGGEWKSFGILEYKK